MLFNPQAKANWEKRITQMHKSHEEGKKKDADGRTNEYFKRVETTAAY